jgi:hypothetical protein
MFENIGLDCDAAGKGGIDVVNKVNATEDQKDHHEIEAEAHPVLLEVVEIETEKYGEKTEDDNHPDGRIEVPLGGDGPGQTQAGCFTQAVSDR